MAYTVSQLFVDLNPPIVVMPDEPLLSALEKMVHNNFSQLPVIKNVAGRKQYFFITTESILNTLYSSGGNLRNSILLVGSALIPVKKTYKEDDDLFDILGDIRDTNAVIVVDDAGELKKVVTSYDVAQYFRQWAEDIMLVREVEQKLKKLIRTAFRDADGNIDEENLKQVVEDATSINKKTRNKFDLAIGQYLKQRSEYAINPNEEWVKQAFAGVIASEIVTEKTTSENQTEVNLEIPELPPSAGFGIQNQDLYSKINSAICFYLKSLATNEENADSDLADKAFIYLFDKSEKQSSFSELTLDTYKNIFLGEHCWEFYKTPCEKIGLSKENVLLSLEDIRKIRNDLAHFREDQVTSLHKRQLKFCLDWLSGLDDLISIVD